MVHSRVFLPHLAGFAIGLVGLLLQITLQGQTVAEATATDSVQYVGQFVTVTDVVDTVSIQPDSPTILTIGTGTRPAKRLKVVINVELAKSLPNPENLRGKLVSVFGRVQMRGDSPEILLTSLDCLRDRGKSFKPVTPWLCPGEMPF
jgi:hypothetical protein